METSDVRRSVDQAIERAKRLAADRRVRADEASQEYTTFLERVAVPLFRQVASVLKTHSYSFTVFTPGGSVRLMSDKNADDYIELLLETSGADVVVIGHTSRRRGGHVIEAEHSIAIGPVRDLSEDVVLGFVLKELEPFVER
jgi:hypothetical protein